MPDKEFQVAASILDDCRRLISAGKSQRWDVVKWGLAVNLGLSAFAAATGPSVILFGLALLVTLASIFLVLHYNRRITGARQTARNVVNWMNRNGVDYNAITLEKGEPQIDSDYDKHEMATFGAILGLSPLLTLLRYLVG